MEVRGEWKKTERGEPERFDVVGKEKRRDTISGISILRLALTVGPLDVYAAADVDVARTVIHGHLVGLTHLRSAP